MANCVKCGRQLPGFSFKKICQWCVQHERAQRGEEGDDAKQPVMAVPWVRRESSITVTHVLFGANVAVFVAMMVATVMAGGAPSTDFSPGISMHFGANYGPFTLTGDWWRLVTYMFLHGGIFHIAMNMWCLWNLGTLCESLYGRWTYLAIYLLTGVAAGVASVAWNPGVWSVGASGALFGLTGALISSFYLGEFSFGGIAIKGTLTSLLFFAGFSLFFGAVFPGIDNAAHVGGLVSGLILGALIAAFAPQEDALMRRVSIFAVIGLAVIASAMGVQRWRGAPLRMMRVSDEMTEKGPDRAIAQLSAIVRQNPNSVEAHYALGREFFNIERFAQAETEFKRVLELRPQNIEARFDLGLTYLSEKRPEDAKAAFAQIVSQDANSADGHYGVGLALADENKYEAAIEEYKEAIRLGPHESGVYYEMGRSYAQLKMYDDAIAAYLNSKERDGDDPDMENALAEAYQAKGMTQQAQDAKNRAAQLKSGQR